jgi:hypothetical protein
VIVKVYYLEYTLSQGFIGGAQIFNDEKLERVK